MEMVTDMTYGMHPPRDFCKFLVTLTVHTANMYIMHSICKYFASWYIYTFLGWHPIMLFNICIGLLSLYHLHYPNLDV